MLLVLPMKPGAHGSRNGPKREEYHSQADGDVELGRAMMSDGFALGSYCFWQVVQPA